ncbi:MAG TPA: hypothetical protein VFV04_00305 [Burkholderiales bacterium]|nr:hypothetical protein [Burkholderiales bacterium]
MIRVTARARPAQARRAARKTRLRGTRLPVLLAWVLVASGASDTAFAHGFAGKRFFPATPTTDDPFVADELSLPTVSRTKTGASGEAPATVTTTTSVDYTKRVTPNFGVGLGASNLRLAPEGGDTVSGADNLAASLKYQFHKNDEHESIASVGVDWDIGNTGAKRIGAESFSTVTPTVFYGKGFGDLPDGMSYLRPFAITGTAGIAMPTRSSTTTVDETGTETTERHPNVLKLGFSLQYSLTYLQSFVKDVGLSEPFNRMIPLIEVSLEKPLDRGGGPTIGTVNPGVLWAGRYMQFGVEAIIPMNNRTPVRGWIAQIHFFMDDLVPRSIGRPIFGAAQ